MQIFKRNNIIKIRPKDLRLIEVKEPSFILEIIAFRKQKKEGRIEIRTDKDFIGLQNCENPDQFKYKDFPNEFQTIFNIYEPSVYPP